MWKIYFVKPAPISPEAIVPRIYHHESRLRGCERYGEGAAAHRKPQYATLFT